MCGIAAIASASAASIQKREERMAQATDRLRSRGPDGKGTWSSACGRITLGHTRLAIIDLSDSGRQPMTNEDGSLVVTFNGEIYNAPDLRCRLTGAGHIFRSQSDTEAIVHGLEEWGLEGLLDRLRGMFAFVAWNNSTQELLGAVDHAGIKPLVWCQRGNSIYAASTCDALISLLDDQPDLNPVSLCHVLCHGYCPAPATVWSGVCKMAPGSAFRWSARAGMKVFTWWDSGAIASRAPDRGTPAPSFDELFQSTVSRHLLADVPIGLLLSAGLDSSAVACALSANGRDLECLTLAMHGDDDESAEARELCSALGLSHSTETLIDFEIEALIRRAARATDEPQGFGALLTMETVARAARRHSKVFLSGDGGDEAFAGYSWHRPVLEARRAPLNIAERNSLAREVAQPGARGSKRAAALASLATCSALHEYHQRIFPRFHPAEAAALFAPLSVNYDEHAYIEPVAAHDDADLPWPRRAQVLDLKGFCAGHVLPKVDRCAMAHGLEIRPVYLDRDLLEWSLSRPSAPDWTPKDPIRRWLRGRVPDRLLERPKQGFSLRASSDSDESTMIRMICESSLVREGLIHHAWEGFVSPDAPSRRARLFAIAFLAEWHEARARSPVGLV